MDEKIKKCLIISGSPENEIPGGININEYYIIAADGGLETAVKNNIKADLAVGDFDTYKGEIPKGTQVCSLSPQKDETDTLVCLSLAKQRGYDDITIINATGGARIDHEFANIQTLMWAENNHLHAKIVSKNFKMMLQLKNCEIYPKNNYKYLSVFSYTNECTRVSITGTKYDVHNISLKNDFPLGVSNEIVAENAVITKRSGCLLVILSSDKAE